MHLPWGWEPRPVIYAEPHDTPPPQSRSREQPGGLVAADRKLILLIDDEQDLLEVTTFVLESEGFRVLTARNGEEALELLRGGVLPELVLLDMMMPVMNGWEFLDEIAKLPSLRAIPIIVLTAAGPSGISGAVEVLRKPVDLGLLVEAVERHATGAE